MKEKRKRIIGVCALVLAAASVSLYLFGDHQPPEVKAVPAYQVDCGTAVTVDELVKEVCDESVYTVTLSGEGEVSEDRRSICFTEAGTFPVQVEVTDAGGKNTKVEIPVITLDVTPPELDVQEIVVQQGEEIKYRDAVSAVDAVDGNLIDQVQVDTVQVTPEKVGTYTAVYSVADQSGNRAEECGLVMIQPAEANGITLDQTELALDGNQYKDLHATVSPKSWDGSVVWDSDNRAVATVSEGMVAWVGVGECVITATADDYTAKCKVTCGEVKETSVHLNENALDMPQGAVTILTAEPIPSNWKGSVTWHTSNSDVAVVKNGVVTAVSPGVCTITASAGTKSASCEITCHSKSVIEDMSEFWNFFVDHS